MNALPIRTRLTAAYAALLAAVLLGFVAITLHAMRVSALAAADDELRSRVEDTRDMLRQGGGLSARTRSQLAQHDSDAFLLQDPLGRIVYESAAARSLHFSPHQGTYTDTLNGNPMRVMSASAASGATLFIAIPLRPYVDTIAGFSTIIVVVAPIALLIATGGGYWLSGRVLRPIDRITTEARAITAQNLDRRLAVPPARDELRVLSETLNAMLDRLQASFQRIAQFTADASHELRSPVALMRTTAEVALNRTRSEAEYRDVIQHVVVECEHLSQLIDNLLILARSDAATDAVEKSTIDVAVPLRAACSKATRPVDLSIAEGSRVLGNAVSLQQLFTILLDNAAKYSPPDTAIAVSLSLRTGHTIVEVRDRGIGIASEDLPHVFERFYRADKARSRGGTGLGLAIAKRIAEIHGGTIEVTSATGEGSTFTVTLPQVQEVFSRAT